VLSEIYERRQSCGVVVQAQEQGQNNFQIYSTPQIVMAVACDHFAVAQLSTDLRG